MLTIGPKEALCVAIFGALVWSAHALLRFGFPFRPGAFHPPLGRIRRQDLLVAVAAAVLAIIAGMAFSPTVWRAALDIARTTAKIVDDGPLTTKPVTTALSGRLAIFLASPVWIALLVRRIAPGYSPGARVVPPFLFLIGGVLGFAVVLPRALHSITRGLDAVEPSLNARDLYALLSTATFGTALVLLAGALAFYAMKPRLAVVDRPERRFVWWTPLLMLTAAAATGSREVFPMTMVFLPMCVSCMAGIILAEGAAALSKGAPAPMSRVLIWGLRFGAESLLGAGVCILILTRWR